MTVTSYRYDNSHDSAKLGFTIVELLVVIVVIGILASITIVSYNGISNRAKIAAIQSSLENNSKKLKLYYATYGAYPTAFDAGWCPSAPNIDSNYCMSLNAGSNYTYTSPSSETFSLIETNSNITYYSTENSSPSDIDTLSSGLAGQWAFDEGVGTDVADSFGGNNGTWNGTLGSQWSTGKVGLYAGTLNGSNNYISTNYIQTSVTEYAISSWVKTTDGGTRKTIVNNRGAAGTGKSLTLGIGPSAVDLMAARDA